MFAKPYLTKLKKELDSYQIEDNLETIYVGGGTPTALEDNLFVELLETIKPYSKGIKEYTFEANPESLSEFKLNKMKEYGVNRISLGVQSTDNEILKSINRHHTYQDVIRVIKKAQEIGFDNINADLILGIPGSSVEQINKDLDNLTNLGISHISCYSLTVNPNTILFLKNIPEPNEELSRQYYDFVNEYLSKKDFIHYEVSNWAKPGKESKHNLTYWKNERYYGVGMGAAGYIDNHRYTNTKSITEYLKGKYIDEDEVVETSDDIELEIMLNLRTNSGIDLDKFQHKFNYDLYKEKRDIIDKNINNNYLFINDNHLIATYEGMMILDQIIMDLVL